MKAHRRDQPPVAHFLGLSPCAGPTAPPGSPHEALRSSALRLGSFPELHIDDLDVGGALVFLCAWGVDCEDTALCVDGEGNALDPVGRGENRPDDTPEEARHQGEDEMECVVGGHPTDHDCLSL